MKTKLNLKNVWFKPALSALIGFFLINQSFAQRVLDDFKLNQIVQVASNVTQCAMDYDVSKLMVPMPYISLPVVFGTQQAKIVQGNLLVDRSRLTEKNKEHFVIEASKDGKNFISIDSVKTKTMYGYSNSELRYNYQKGLSSSVSCLGLGISTLAYGMLIYLVVALALFLFTFSDTKKINRRKLGSIIIGIALSSAFTFTGCKKYSKEIAADAATKVFIRITQLDTDGARISGKVMQAVKG